MFDSYEEGCVSDVDNVSCNGTDTHSIHSEPGGQWHKVTHALFTRRHMTADQLAG